MSAPLPALLLISNKVVPVASHSASELVDLVAKETGFTVQVPSTAFSGGYTQLVIQSDAVCGVLS